MDKKYECDQKKSNSPHKGITTMVMITAAMFVWWDWLGLQHFTTGGLIMAPMFLCRADSVPSVCVWGAVLEETKVQRICSK